MSKKFPFVSTVLEHSNIQQNSDAKKKKSKQTKTNHTLTLLNFSYNIKKEKET